MASSTGLARGVDFPLTGDGDATGCGVTVWGSFLPFTVFSSPGARDCGSRVTGSSIRGGPAGVGVSRGDWADASSGVFLLAKFFLPRFTARVALTALFGTGTSTSGVAASVLAPCSHQVLARIVANTGISSSPISIPGVHHH